MVATSTPQSATRDKHHDLISVTHLCFEQVWRLEQYARSARREGDDELAALLSLVREHCRCGAEASRRLLERRLADEGE